MRAVNDLLVCQNSRKKICICVWCLHNPYRVLIVHEWSPTLG